MSDDPHAGAGADNKRLWEAWTAIHTTGSSYDVDRFRSGPADLRIRPFEHVAGCAGGGETLSFPVQGTYADPGTQVDAEVEHRWNHSLGRIVTGLARNGLRIDLLDEKPWLEW